MIKVAVIGSTGQLGTDLVEVLDKTGDYRIFPLSHTEMECTDPRSVRRALTTSLPQIVINCASFVRVDECEDQPDMAFQVNTVGALCVARVCAELEALCVYISTDFVFDGEKGSPYTEEDVPYPVNVYGTSKLAGEHLVKQSCPRWLIVRLASLFGKAGSRGKGGNFLETVLARAVKGETLNIVDDIRMSPTYATDAAWALHGLLQREATGLYHVTNEGSCTWYQFARRALELAGVDGVLQPSASHNYALRARRPRDSSLESRRLSNFIKGRLRPWEDALEAYLVEKGYRQKGCGSRFPV